MTRKDYILIAEVLRVEHHRAVLDSQEQFGGLAFTTINTINNVALSLCDSLHRDNPRFNRDHFMDVVRGKKELLSRPGRAA